MLVQTFYGPKKALFQKIFGPKKSWDQKVLVKQNSNQKKIFYAKFGLLLDYYTVFHDK